MAGAFLPAAGTAGLPMRVTASEKICPMTVYLRRRASFSTGFQQPPPGETGRGHDYLVELTVGGEIDPRTGMVVNIKDVDAVLKAQVVQPLHGTLLDQDIPGFRETPPTPENLARFIWKRCVGALPPEGRLARVTLQAASLKAELSRMPLELETPLLFVTRTYDFSASHRLHSSSLSGAENAEIFGKCNWENGHGHNYEVEVTLAGDPDPATGQLWDGVCLDRIVKEQVLDPYDHKHLNYDTADFRTRNPTSENLTVVIWQNLSRCLAREETHGARLHRVAVRETPRNYFEYYGEAAGP